jgi:ketosteroid isomerase-like protein
MNSPRLTRCVFAFALVVSLLSACKNTANPVARTEKLIRAFAAAWDGRDADKLLAYYSEEVKSYDATAYGMWFDYALIDDVLHSYFLNGEIKVDISSFFVSDDGRYAATFGTYAEKDASGGYDPVPYVSLIRVEQDKIVWVYDYYGGTSSEALPLQEIPASASRPASSDQAIADARSMVAGWETAYNSKDIDTFSSYYADQANYTQVVKPEWRVLAKEALLEDMTSRFSDAQFTSSVADFFISADGHYAAVQGTYDDAQVNLVPMVIILKMENGRIIEQYDYLVL